MFPGGASPTMLLQRASTWIAAQIFQGNVTCNGVFTAGGSTSWGFKSLFTSAEQTITAGGTLTIAHGLGAVPKIIEPILRCKTAELGYAINDEINIDQMQNAASNYGLQIWADATNIYCQYGLGGGAFTILKRTATAGQSSAITAGNWRLLLKAWA